MYIVNDKIKQTCTNSINNSKNMCLIEITIEYSNKIQFYKFKCIVINISNMKKICIEKLNITKKIIYFYAFHHTDAIIS